ncbi:GNAT family N-acetyltransferase [Niallia sp. 03133]|uniref:GNAT family N-acetyltransferase n=1 Tax=Niallia sp. 03133 TaxID=3458060 RepID=UPI00404492A6
MITQLTEKEHNIVMHFLKKEPSINLFIIGDIEAFGYETSFQRLWGEWQNNKLKAVLLEYYDNYTFYAEEIDNFDLEGFIQLLKATTQPIKLSGKSDLVEKFENIPGLILSSKKITFFSECTSTTSLPSSPATIKEAKVGDIDRIISLRKTIKEFDLSPNSHEMLKKAIESKTGRTYYIENNRNEIIACVSTTAETSISAMIVGVCTRFEYRNQGFASSLLSSFVQNLLKEKQTLCLFYDNPIAGRLYKRLGFIDIGKWTMHR